jgi:hypothetical protein
VYYIFQCITATKHTCHYDQMYQLVTEVIKTVVPEVLEEFSTESTSDKERQVQFADLVVQVPKFQFLFLVPSFLYDTFVLEIIRTDPVNTNLADDDKEAIQSDRVNQVGRNNLLSLIWNDIISVHAVQVDEPGKVIQCDLSPEY